MKKITAIQNGKGIRIKFTLNKIPYRFSPVPNGEWANHQDREKAQAIALKIQSDIQLDKFDPTLTDYRSDTQNLQVELAKSQENLRAIADARSRENLRTLWEKYQEYKSKSLSPLTIEKDFKGRIGHCLNILPTLELSKAREIEAFLLENKGASEVKKILTQFSACCKWAVKRGFINSNPFEGMAKDIKVSKAGKSDTNVFSESEMQLIINAFEGNHYHNFVIFLFGTGARLSEVRALKWSDFNDGWIHFNKSYSEGIESKTTKQAKERRVKLHSEVVEFLNKIPRDNELIFPSITGGHINGNYFCEKIWKPIIHKLGIEYRSPRQTRHGFISEQLKRGSVQDVSQYVGNRPNTVFNHYAGRDRNWEPS